MVAFFEESQTTEVKIKPCKDVKTYVKILPLPYGSPHGVKLQARNAFLYSMASPSRNEVRKQNYDRRHRQFTSQGFRTPSHKPYASIGGEPILNEEKLVVTALGQEVPEAMKTPPPVKPVFKRQYTPIPKPDYIKYGKKALNKGDVDHDLLFNTLKEGEQQIAQQRLGKDVFPEMVKENEQVIEERPKSVEFLVPQDPNSTLIEELQYDVSSLFDEARVIRPHTSVTGNRPGKFRFRNHPPKSAPAKTTSGSVEEIEVDGIIEDDDSTADISDDSLPSCAAKPLKGVDNIAHFETRRRHGEIHRPFTPKQNIFDSTKSDPIVQGPIYKQLCALLWLLNSLNVENNYTYTALATCYNAKSPGGERTRCTLHEQKDIEEKWQSRIINDATTKQETRKSNNSNLQSSSRYSMRKASTSSVMSSQSSFQPIRSSSARSGLRVPSARVFEEIEPIHPEPLDEMAPSGTGPTLFVSSPIAETPTQRSRSAKQRTSTAKDSHNFLFTQKKSSEFDGYDEDYFTTISEKYSSLPAKIRKDFELTSDEYALNLKDIISFRDMMKIETFEAKYFSLGKVLRNQKGFVQDLKRMRLKAATMIPERPKEKYCKWFKLLLIHFKGRLNPDTNKLARTLFNKLEYYGTLGNMESKRLTKTAFLSLLSGLKPWELCEGAVKAAVDFCREHIIKMEESDFKKWFQEFSPDYASLIHSHNS